MSQSHTRSRKGNPYIPSYMDLTNGPELCVVCGDAATGYHYRCMTCEGCKGFFRRTIQKGLKYVCKGEHHCSVDKSNRNQCQECRYQKCLEVGMATDLVLDDKQRKAKRQLISENRERRKLETIRSQIVSEETEDKMSDPDRSLIHEITKAFAETVDQEVISLPQTAQLRDMITPSVIRIISFGKKIPGFSQLATEDQIVLLKGCSVELMFLKIARQFDLSAGLLVLPSGRRFCLSDIQQNLDGLGPLLGPVYAFGHSLSRMQLSDCEMAMVASLMLMNYEKRGLQNKHVVEQIQDVILSAFKRHVSETHPGDFVRWAKLLMLASELRAIGSHQADKILLAGPEHSALVMEMFGYSADSF